MKIGLSDHFTYKKLMIFTLPSIAMMIFSSIYGVVDGFFVSNFVNETAFTAVNFIFPFLMILGAFGFMLGTGGCALIAKTMGEGKPDKAKRLFSMIIYVSLGLGAVLAAVAFVFIRPIAAWLGAEGQMLDYCVLYARINLIAMPALILQFEFQSFFVAAEKPNLGLWITVAAGVTNMVLDALLVGVLSLGLVGAAIATAMSQVVGGIVPLFYFARKNTSLLRIVKPEFDGRALVKVCTNGSSEFLSNVSMSLVGMLYNAQLMKYAGENGVAAYGVLMYVNFVFISYFIGYVVGTAPIVSYHYGAKNYDELKNIVKKSIVIIGVVSVLMLVMGETLAGPFSRLFVAYNPSLFDMTHRAFLIYSFSFLFAGISIFGSSFFTALNNGFLSALISFFRTALFQVVAVLVLPIFFDLDGIWLSVVVAEVIAAVVAVVVLISNRKRYHY